MKNVIILALTITFIGCKKEKSEADATIKNQLQGKWQFVHQVEQTWEPINTLSENEDTPMEAGDSIVFKGNKVYGYYDTSTGVEIEEYEFSVKDNVLFVDDEEWVIKKLNDTELVLEQEDIDQANNRKDVLINYLER